MHLHLEQKVAIVTGASKGIGRAIAQTLAEEGMRLTIVARSRAQLDDLASPLGDTCLVQAADLTKADAPAAVVAATMSRFGRIDLVVNNAGSTKRGDFLTLSEADWADGFGLKFYAAMRLSRAVASSAVLVRRHHQHRWHWRPHRFSRVRDRWCCQRSADELNEGAR